MNYKATLQANRDDAALLRELVREVNAYDGSLESYEAYDFDDDFFDTYFENKPEEAARAVFFGNIQNWLDEYVRFNGYGNLESLTAYQYDQELQEYADDIFAEALRLQEEGNLDLAEIFENYDVEVTK